MIKKCLRAILAISACCLATVVFCGAQSAYAADNVQKYVKELSAEKITATALLGYDDYSYKATLYSSQDTKYENPLSENFHNDGYVFTECGDYIVKYFLTHNETGAKSEVTLTYRIKDSTAPSISLDKPFYEYAEVGSTITLPEAVVKDCSLLKGETIVKVSVGGVDCTGDLSGLNLFVRKAGKYSVTYTAKDVYDNESEKTYSFIAIDGSEDVGKGGCGSSLFFGDAAGLTVLGAGLVFATFKVVKRKFGR